MGRSGPRLERLVPHAEVLVESLRDIGYSMTTAVADIVDNSIAAGARRVELRADTADAAAAFAVIDDGHGMTSDELRKAMRPGSRSPREERTVSDLGRFGLGLKTASFSQCRRLTVLTRRNGQVSAARWDLDTIAREGDWLVEWVDDVAALRWADLLPASGTMVLWEKLDRPSAGDSGRTLTRLVDEIGRHLSLAFHRFLAPERGETPVAMILNGRTIAANDPFAEWHPATIRGPEEVIPFGRSQVIVRAFTLPHHAKATPAEWKRMEGDLGHLRSQGFYLYRGRRLIVMGTWFGLAKQAEFTKLARVRIDIANDADSAWGIDVRKSAASPPPAIRERLRRIIETITGSSRRTYERRGVRLTEDHPLPVWRRRTSDAGIAYDLDEAHPTFRRLAERLGPDGESELVRALHLVATTLPLDALLHDLTERPKEVSAGAMSEDEAEVVTRDVVERLRLGGMTPDLIRNMLAPVPPFRDHPGALDRVITNVSGGS